MKSLWIAALAALASGAADAGEAAPLFESADPLSITIYGPVTEIVEKAAVSTDPKPATLIHDGAEMTIELSARGNARRRPENCKFPPLRVKFTDAPGKDSAFHKQKTLKLVTHCRAQPSFQKHTLLEYAAYRIYNEVTEASFRVRLAQVRYVDSLSGKTVAERLGFFIEDADDVADRVGLKEIESENLSLSQHDKFAAARAVLFFHMIANHDWSMLAGPDGECCHNGNLLGTDRISTSNLVFVPYDFDYSGFVGAPYATPPASLAIKSVRSRYYRGDCALNDEVRQAAALFREKRNEIESAVRYTPKIEHKTAESAVKYLKPFFSEIADDDAVEKLLKRCR